MLLFRSVLCFGVLAVLCCVQEASGQAAAEKYKAAAATLKLHSSEDGILNDDTPAARAALEEMWAAVRDAVIEILNVLPSASPEQIDSKLCSEGIAAAGCNEGFAPQHDILRLGTNLYVVAVATQTGGTVLIVGPKDGKPTQLWAIHSATVLKAQDPHDLIGAWHVNRSGGECRRTGSAHKAGSCGPLYSELGLLPSDAQGRPRFYVDAGYEQSVGATIGKQTSVWRWDGTNGQLLWIDFYSAMIDQMAGTSFDRDKGTLLVGEKGYFKTMYSCGSCIDRPLDHSILLTKEGVEDLGTRSLAPELDQIDKLLAYLQAGRSVAGLASPQVSAFLQPGVAQSKKQSNQVEKGWFSVGMIMSSMVKLTARGAQVCVEPDEVGALQFVLRRTQSGGYFIEHVASTVNNVGCSRGAFLTPEAGTNEAPR